MTERTDFERDPRGYALNLVDEGLIDARAMLRDAINWMSTDDAAEFLEANGYAPDEDEPDEEDEDEEDSDA